MVMVIDAQHRLGGGTGDKKLSKYSGEIERGSYSAQHPMNIGNLYHRFA